MRVVPYSDPERNHKWNTGECHRTRQHAKLGGYLLHIREVR
jgi:hypothetical protein